MSVRLLPASRARASHQHVSGTISVGGQRYGPECGIKMADPERAYLQVPDGKRLKRQKAILFSSTYVFPPANSWMKWACPVDNCSLEAQNLRGLARHWRVCTAASLRGRLNHIDAASSLILCPFYLEHPQVHRIQRQWRPHAYWNRYLRRLDGRGTGTVSD